MGRTSLRLARIGAAVALSAFGFIAYDAVTQVASAAPPPVVTTDYAAYPLASSVPATCTGGAGGLGVLQGYRAFLQRPGGPNNVAPFVDPGPGGTFSTARSMRRFETQIQVGDSVVIRWDSWTAGCEGLPISFPLKATNRPFFDVNDDQALVREPNGPFNFPFCYSSGAESCPRAGGGFELSTVIPQLNVVCGYQLDVVIGGPLETVGPHGSYYQTQNRVQANGLGLGTFNPNGPNMLIDAANGAMPCSATDRIVVDKEWVGTGTVPPANLPADFQLTVTSSSSQSNLALLSTATCGMVAGTFTCNYVDTAAPGVPQGGLLVNADSLLTVSETSFPGNTVDVTFPVGLSSQYIFCLPNGGACQLTVTNTPPPPPPPPTTPPTTPPPTTTPPPGDTSIAPTTVPTTSPLSIPNTLPATGSSGSAPLLLLGAILLPAGAVLVAVTRRRAGVR
jgi:LPXTG-motif cell wall-anchored protein